MSKHRTSLKPLAGAADTPNMGAHLRRPLRDESGFTLVEAVVSLMILGIIFSALALAAVGTLRASLNSRAEQQAIDFATQALENARQYQYASLANVGSDMAGDSRVQTVGSVKKVDPGDGIDPEPLVLSANGIPKHVITIPATTANRVSFTVSTYVTSPGDSTADYKRVTVVTTWVIAGKQRERSVSSLVTATTRGLPVPIFKLTPLGNTSTALNPGARATFGFELTNQGAPDVWDVTTASWGSWTLYRDDGDGRLCLQVSAEPGGCSAVDPLMGDSDDAGSTPDTGRINPTEGVVFWATTLVPANESSGNHWAKLTADSASTTQAGVGVSYLDLLVQVVSGTVTATPPPPPPVATVPGSPQSLVATPSDRTVTLVWSAPASQGSSAITDYVIRYRKADDPTLPWNTLNDATSPATTATITGLNNGTKYDVQVFAVNAVGMSATPAAALATPFDENTYFAPAICPASPSAPSGTAATGFSMRAYALHNRSDANSAWPSPGNPTATTTTGQGIPLKMAVDGSQFGAGVNLPVYSQDVVAGERGRVLLSGGSFSTTDAKRVVDWRTNVAGKAYSGAAVLRFWVAPVSGDPTTGLGYSLSAQLYRQSTSDSGPSNFKLANPQQGAAVDLNAASFTCAGGWQEVWFQIPVVTNGALENSKKKTEYLGLRVWNTGGPGKASRVRIAYDVAGDFPATLSLPES